MIFSAGLENENSFLIIPNEFVKDHALTQEEVTEYLTPDSGYEKAYRASYKYFPEKPLAEQIRLLFKRDNAYKILRLKMLWNKLLGRRLYSRYE